MTPERDVPTRRVLLLHGLARSGASMAPLARALRPHLPAETVDYPSLGRDPLEAHARRVNAAIAAAHADEVDLVTHSMGAIVLRHALADPGAPWRGTKRIGRVAMIAPPNQGSAVARLAIQLFGPRLVPAVAELARDRPAPAWSGDARALTVIAGAPATGGGYNPLLDGPNDGTVTLAETRLDGADALVRLPGLHSLLPAQPNVAHAVLAALHLPPVRYATGAEVAADLGRAGPPGPVATRRRNPVIQPRRTRDSGETR